MDENDLAKMGMEIVLRPVTDVLENAIGYFGGDALSETRKRNRARLREKTEKILRERKAKIEQEVSPSVVIPLLAAAQDESQEELLDIYAKLLAAAADPKRRGSFRKEFIDVAKQMEPIDALVLEKIQSMGSTRTEPERSFFFSQQLQVPQDHITNSFAALLRLRLTDDKPGQMNPQVYPMLSAFGRQFLAALAG